jgi:integrase
VDYRWMLAEPGAPHARGAGTAPGLLMARFGDRRAQEITTREVAEYLRTLDRSGSSPRMVNRHRQVISAIYGYAMREDAYAMRNNPASGTSRRREPPPAVLDFYEPEEVEAIARAAQLGAHRNVVKLQLDEDELAARSAEDHQDGELIRVAAYTGLRLGELLALRWDDVNLVDRRLVVQRALSDRARARPRAGRPGSSRSPTRPPPRSRASARGTTSPPRPITCSATGSAARWTAQRYGGATRPR